MAPSAAALRYQSAIIPCTLRHGSRSVELAMMKKSSSGHVIGVPVISKAYGIEEEASRDPSSFSKGGDVDADHLAVSFTHPSPYASFGYKHSESLVPCMCIIYEINNFRVHSMLTDVLLF